MSDVTKALEAVSALTGERTKYEGWIAALATKADVPAHVLEKVRLDYTSRLRTVLQGFAAYTPVLEAAAADLRSRDAALSAEERGCRDEYAEGELRHMVGEYDDDQWNAARTGHEAVLTRVAKDREGVAGELASVQQSLASVGDASKRASGMSASDGPAEPSREQSPTPAINTAMREPVTQPVPVPAPEPAPVDASAPVSVPPASATSFDRQPPVEELEFLRNAERATPRDDLSGESLRVSTPTPPARTAEAPALRIVTESASNVASATPTGGVDAAKTLRCAECGTMNYPTEWYCERCGGELAVL